MCCNARSLGGSGGQTTKAIDREWERLRSIEMRPDIGSLFSSVREMEYLAPSATAWQLSRAGMAAAAGLPPGQERKLSLKQQFGTPY